jgi:hypothetical protein
MSICETPQVDATIGIKAAAQRAGPGLDSELQNRRISKVGIDTLCILIKSIEFLPPAFDIYYSIF